MGEGGLNGMVGTNCGVGVASGCKPGGQRQLGSRSAEHDSPSGRPDKKKPGKPG